MSIEEKYMQRCLQLASNGLGIVAPNPMVGCVIVCDDRIVGEGFHHEYGGPHAEVNAINSVKDKNLLINSTLYVNLEPCAHHGKTPPCSDLIIKHQIPRVVIGAQDSNPQVGGKGIEKLRKSGIKVSTSILEKECRNLNKRFFTFHEKKKPYIILKWAQSSDGFIDHIRDEVKNQPATISNDTSRTLVHKWRSEEQAIMIGTNTAILDNPRLNVRLYEGKNPLRVILDRQNRLPDDLHILDGSVPTIIFTAHENVNAVKAKENLEYVLVEDEVLIYDAICTELYKRNIQSILIEGGSLLLNNCIREDLWDETRLFVSKKVLGNGIHAPQLEMQPITQEDIAGDTLYLYRKSTNAISAA